MVAQANQAMPAAFSRATNAAGKTPMMDDTTGGRAASSASHWAAKSGGATSPASGGTDGPKPARKSRTRASCAASRTGGASGIHRFI